DEGTGANVPFLFGQVSLEGGRDANSNRSGDSGERNWNEKVERERQQDKGDCDEDVIFERGAKHERVGRCGSVKVLEKPAAEYGVVDDAALEKDAEFGGRVDATTPDPTPERIEVLRMFCSEESFGLAVTFLLLAIRLYGGAAVMPYETSGTEADP